MAYASSLRREYRGERWPLPEQSSRRLLNARAKARPIGWSADEGRAVLEALRRTADSELLHSALRKLQDWIARYEPNELECLHCGYHWLSNVPRGQVPKRCQICGGYADVEGESMIVAVVRDG